jgi:hypothetical protein
MKDSLSSYCKLQESAQFSVVKSEATLSYASSTLFTFTFLMILWSTQETNLYRDIKCSKL